MTLFYVNDDENPAGSNTALRDAPRLYIRLRGRRARVRAMNARWTVQYVLVESFIPAPTDVRQEMQVSGQRPGFDVVQVDTHSFPREWPGRPYADFCRILLF